MLSLFTQIQIETHLPLESPIITFLKSSHNSFVKVFTSLYTENIEAKRFPLENELSDKYLGKLRIIMDVQSWS